MPSDLVIIKNSFEEKEESLTRAYKLGIDSLPRSKREYQLHCLERNINQLELDNKWNMSYAYLFKYIIIGDTGKYT